MNGIIGKDDPIDYGLLDDGIAASSAALRPMCEDPVLTVSQVCTDIRAPSRPEVRPGGAVPGEVRAGFLNYDPEDVEKCKNKCEGTHCCLEKEAKCLSCINGMSIGEYCAKNKGVRGCDGKEPVCPERMKWNDCGTACPLKCGKERPEFCMQMCVSGCECEGDLFLTPEGTCVKEKECPIMIMGPIANGNILPIKPIADGNILPIDRPIADGNIVIMDSPIGNDPDRICCKAMTAQCLACAEGVSPHEYCQEYPQTEGCKREPDSMDGNIGIIMDGSPIGTNGFDGICCKAMTAPGVRRRRHAVRVLPEVSGDDRVQVRLHDVCYDDAMEEKDDLEARRVRAAAPRSRSASGFDDRGLRGPPRVPRRMEWTERRPACPMKCGKTGRPSNPRCSDPIKPGAPARKTCSSHKRARALRRLSATNPRSWTAPPAAAHCGRQRRQRRRRETKPPPRKADSPEPAPHRRGSKP